MKKIAIVTDSSATLTADEIKELNITVLPLMINFSDGTSINDDDVSQKKIFEKADLEKLRVTTSHVSIGVIQESWRILLKTNDEVIFFPLSKGLSGEFNVATKLAKTEEFLNKVHVVDFPGVAKVLTVAIKATISMIQKGITDYTRIKEKLDEIANNFSSVIIPDDLDYLVRGGRVTKAVAMLAGVLKIKPILRFNGKIDKIGTVRTLKKAWKEANKIVISEQKINKDSNYISFIQHSICDDSTLQTLSHITHKNKELVNSKVTLLPAAIAVHTGPSTFCLILIKLPKDININ